MHLLNVQRVFQRDVVVLDQFIEVCSALSGDKARFQDQQLIHPALDGLLTELVVVLPGSTQKTDP